MRKLGQGQPRSLFVQTMMGLSPQYYILSSVKIGPAVLEKKILKGF